MGYSERPAYPRISDNFQAKKKRPGAIPGQTELIYNAVPLPEAGVPWILCRLSIST